jgi:antitoxin component of RelBE/YafQ-DinJ toxin-antitoxin module
MKVSDTYVRARIDGAAKKGATVPNATTRKAIAELEAGKGKRLTSTEALMADLNADSHSDLFA